MTLIIKTGIIILNVIYALIKLFPVREKVTMISRQSNQPSDDFCLIRDEIKRRDPNVQVVLLCRTLEGGVKATVFDKLRYCFHMLTQMYHIATSRVVILDTYCMVISVLKHKKDLKIIQIWHSIGTMKKFGYTALDTAEGSRSKLAYAMKMHQNYDYVFAASDAYKEHLASGFHCDIRKIITMPLPRVDLLRSAEYAEKTRSRIYSVYPKLKDKPVILYCPTFRKDETEFAEAFRKLYEAVDHDRYHFVVKLHPLSRVKFGENALVAEGFSSFEMLFAADYVISDYSCIIYEAGILNIPLYFYNFDMDFYTGGRGLAIDYEHELPGVISKDPKVIVDAIENRDYNMEELRRFTNKYIEPTEHATKDIVDFVFQFIE